MCYHCMEKKYCKQKGSDPEMDSVEALSSKVN